jgi:hypothetical protein
VLFEGSGETGLFQHLHGPDPDTHVQSVFSLRPFTHSRRSVH